MLEIESLSLPPFFQKISLTLSEGSITGILGENGSGKSSFLKACSKILNPKEGSFTFKGKDILKHPSHELISLVPEMQLTLFDYSVEEFILMGRYGLTKKAIISLEEVLQAVDLDKIRKRSLTKLSQGERQRLLIARALFRDTPIFLFDEPTSNLDLRHISQLIQVLKKSAPQKYIVIATHDISFAKKIFDHVILLKEGKVLAKGEAKTILTPHHLSALYGIDFDELNSDEATFYKNDR